MLRLRHLPYETAKAQYSPKARKIIGKPTSVKRASHRANHSDVPKIPVTLSPKALKGTLRIPQIRDASRLVANSIISPKARQSAATSRPKTFSANDHTQLTLTTSLDLVPKPKYSSSGISTEQILQSYSCRANEYQEELQEVWKTIKTPCTPSTVLKNFITQLSNYEQNEILSYSEIYYFGLGSKKVKNNLNSTNYGYDDERGDYKVVIGDHIGYRYEVLKILGQGSFGQVLRVLDHKTNEKLALKIIRNKSRFHKQALVEIEVLKHLKENDLKNSHCVIHISDNFMFRKHVVFAM